MFLFLVKTIAQVSLFQRRFIMKLTRLFVMIILITVVLSACSPAATNVVPDQGAQAAQTSEPAVQAEPVDLKLTFWGGELDAQVYQKRIDLFMAKNPDIKIELVYIPSDYSQKVQTMIAGGTAPDIMQLAEDIHSYSAKARLSH
jgi:ABC-type glycerol-3-phosphate transport system substrate-binding protein